MPLFTQTDWTALLAAAIGAALGAVFAFSLEALRQWRKERRLRYSALMRAQFVLGMQLETLNDIWDQHLKDSVSDPERFSTLRVLHYHAPDTRVNFDALAFVAAGNRVESLRRVHAAQEAFLYALQALDIRNGSIARVFSLDAQLESLDVETGKSRVTVDPRWVNILKGETDGLYDTIEAAIKIERRGLGELADVSMKLFPRKPVASIERLVASEPPPS